MPIRTIAVQWNNKEETVTTIENATAEFEFEFERLAEIARTTPCEFEGCDGEAHDWSAQPENWHHTVVKEKFDNGFTTVELSTVSTAPSTYEAFIESEGSGDMTAAELRESADLYESYPAWLRGLADRLDALNAVEAR